MTWNIERGYELDAVISSLGAIDADVISLQEIDIGCERSGGVDTGAAIASALGGCLAASSVCNNDFGSDECLLLQSSIVFNTVEP